jgi:hypothetical protein
MSASPAPNRAAPLAVVLAISFFGSVGGGAFWSGIFFVTAGHYHFSAVRNLVLAAAMGVCYAIAARFTGNLLRALERHFSPRAILAGALSLWGLVALVPLAARRHEPLLWAVAILGASTSAIVWPVVESYLGAGRHGAKMRAAIGWFNVTWTPATAVSLFLLPLFARIDLLWAIAVSALGNLVALVAVGFLPTHPGHHEPDAAAAAVGREYPALRRAASWLLPLSYLMSSTLAPILPHRLAAFGAALPTSIIAATWMVARFATLVFMWRLGFWHGRWGTLLAGGVGVCGGVALVFLAPSLPLVVLGLALFGTGAGLTYYAALYYTLAVGHAAVDAGGTFEALIGLGYMAGPLLGIGGQAFGPWLGLLGPDPGARARAATVTLTWLAASFFVVRAARVYVTARKRRS